MKLPVRRFLAHVIPGVIKPLHVLWNEVVGFIFLVLAAWVVPSIVRGIREFNPADAGSLFRIALSILWTLIMCYFGVSSFLRARKIKRS